jgi:hypothetical protein
MKNNDSNTDGLSETKNPDFSEIEERVDAMMNLDREGKTPPRKAQIPHGEIKPQTVPDSATALPPIDIFSDLKTAPEITPELVNQMSLPPDQETDTNIAVSHPDAAIVAPADEIKLGEVKEDSATAKAVDDIVKQEGDAVLDAESGIRRAQKIAAMRPRKKSYHLSIKAALIWWWHNKWARYGSLVALVLAVLITAAIPTARYAVLNVAGVHGSAQITVLDDTTKLPLKNVVISLGASTALTNKSGVAQLTGVTLGMQKLVVHKVAFSTTTQDVTIALGANQLPNLSLHAVGNQYHIMVVDYVSGKPIASSEAVSGQASAVADAEGTIILTSQAISDSVGISINAADYRAETVSVPVGTAAVTLVRMVPSRPDMFVSKASGTYDVYRMDVDGKNKQVLLPGTGLETNAMSLLVQPSDAVAAVVSTRDNLRNGDGYLLQALTIVNASSGKNLFIDHAEKIQVIDWFGDRLVYVRVKAGSSAGNTERYQMESYDYKSGQTLELAHANNFNDIVSAKGNIYYAANDNFNNGQSYFAKIAADGTSKQVILNSDVSNIFWPDYAEFNLSSGSDWYSYHIGSNQATKLPSSPAANPSGRLYIDNASHKQSAWVDTRDGQGVLLVHDDVSGKDTVITSAVGLSYPVSWLNGTTLIYRVASPKETADHMISTDAGSGAAQKITDLTNVAGLSRWYYY